MEEKAASAACSECGQPLPDGEAAQEESAARRIYGNKCIAFPAVNQSSANYCS